jgi:hypothetical protein
MSLFFIRLRGRPEPESRSSGEQLGDEPSVQAVERSRQQAVEHFREVKANYWLEQRVFF